MTELELKKKNPWRKLIKEVKNNKYRLVKDKKYFSNEDEGEILIEYNKNRKGKVSELHLEILPYHFSGNVLDAPIMLLTANPAFGIEEKKKGFYSETRFIKENIEHLNFKRKFFMEDSIDRMAKSDYYYKKLWTLIKEFGFEKVSKNISLMEFFPYSSLKFPTIGSRILGAANCLPSQKFGFDVVKYAIKEGKVIVIVWKEKDWYKHVEGLMDYPNKVVLRHLLNWSLKKEHCLEPKDFQKILKVLNTAK